MNYVRRHHLSSECSANFANHHIDRKHHVCVKQKKNIIHTCFACAFLHVGNWYVSHSTKQMWNKITNCAVDFSSVFTAFGQYSVHEWCAAWLLLLLFYCAKNTNVRIRVYIICITNIYRCINIIIITTSIICMHSFNNNANDAIETVQMNGQYCLFIEYRVYSEAQSINVPIESNLTALVYH